MADLHIYPLSDEAIRRHRSRIGSEGELDTGRVLRWRARNAGDRFDDFCKAVGTPGELNAKLRLYEAMAELALAEQAARP